MENNPLAGCILSRRFDYKPCIVGVGSARRTRSKGLQTPKILGVHCPVSFIVEERHTADLPKRPGVRHLKVTPTMRNLLRSGKANRIAGRDDISGFQTGKGERIDTALWV